MTDYGALRAVYASQITKSLNHLEYSIRKTSRLSTDPSSLSSEDLEAWEGLASRFARTADIFLMKFLRVVVLAGDPGFRGSLRDFLDAADKAGLIADVAVWLEIRELRNRAAHEYQDERLKDVFADLRRLAPTLMDLRSLVTP